MLLLLPLSKSYNAEAHCDRIFGKHVAKNMKLLQDESEDSYKCQFSKLIEAGVTADGLEGMYKKSHDAIRANADREAKKQKEGAESKRWNAKKLTHQQRKHRIVNKKVYYRHLKAQQDEE